MESGADEWAMTQVGGRVAVRVTVPLISGEHVEAAAAVFSQLAADLQAVAESDAKVTHKIFDARWSIMRAQRKLKNGKPDYKGAR